MNKNKLGKTELIVSKIGLGTVQFGLDYGFTKKKSQDEVDQLLDYANKNGVNLIDTARSYGDSEEKIGNYISQNKNDFIIATKLEKISLEDAESKDKLKRKIVDSIEISLKMLKINFIHALQLHQTDAFLIDNDDFWEILFSLKAQGVIKALGISVYEEPETVKLINDYGDNIDFFQVPYNIFDRRFEKLQRLFETKQIGVISRSVFLKGVITCPPEKLPEELKELEDYKNRLVKIAKSFSLNSAEAALIYVYAKKFISSTILGIDNINELAQNLDIIKKEQTINNFSLFDDLKVENQKLIDPRKWTSL